MRLLVVLSCASFAFLSCNGSETDPVFGASTAASVSSERLSSWDQAARWGDHRDAGY